jgi:hypothetical protein
MIDYERTVLEFLFTEENLPIALEVSKLVEQLRKEVHVEFWLAFRDALEETLSRSECVDSWETWMTAKDQLLADWASCKLTPQRVSTDQLFIRPCLQQGSSRYDYYLHYGLVWNQPVKGDHGIDQVADLVSRLSASGFSTREDWWVGSKNLDYCLGSDAFLLRMAMDREGFVDELVQTLWVLFENNYDLIQAANRALASR